MEGSEKQLYTSLFDPTTHFFCKYGSSFSQFSFSQTNISNQNKSTNLFKISQIKVSKQLEII